MKNLYGDTFYKDRHNSTVYTTQRILSIIFEKFPEIRSAADFGCGVGTWLSVDSIISWINKFIHHSSINLKGSNKETSNIIYGKLNTYWGRKCFVKKHKYINFPNRNAFFYIKLLLNKLRG